MDLSSSAEVDDDEWERGDSFEVACLRGRRPGGVFRSSGGELGGVGVRNLGETNGEASRANKGRGGESNLGVSGSVFAQLERAE